MMKQTTDPLVATRTTTPHDATFRQFLSDPGFARDFIEVHLPDELQQMCDFSTLRLEQGSFIDEDLRTYFSDVLYSLKTTAGDSYIQVLIEHQSSPDKDMAFRLMRYAIAAMQRQLDAGQKYLPLVIPILFYSGRRKGYPCSMNWFNAFRYPDLARYVYNQDFPLVDVTVLPDDEILRHRRMSAPTLLLKHEREGDLLDVVDKLAAAITDSALSPQQLRLVINYMVATGKTADAHALLTELQRQVPQRGDEMMTIAEQLKQEGFEKGIEKGMEKGVQKGKDQRSTEIAQMLLQAGLDAATVIQTTGLTREMVEEIQYHEEL